MKRKIVPDGNYFGNEKEDEFKVKIKGKDKGVFKRLEYLSLPFSITNKEDLFEELYNKACENTSIDSEIKTDPKSNEIVKRVFGKMKKNPEFSKQALEMRLPIVYLKDRTIAQIPLKSNFAEQVARIAFSWKEMKDFYCIEGLVGGDGEGNPFELNGTEYSPIAGGLDCLETNLGTIFEKIDEKIRKKVALQISSLINREYTQVLEAIKILGIIHGKEKELNQEEISDSISLLGELAKTNLNKNVEFGKFFNTVIRFHNWMPNQLKDKDPIGESYDSICVPTKKALENLKTKTEYKGIIKDIEQIKDATSPKGLALISLIGDCAIPGKEKILGKLEAKEKELKQGINKGLEDFKTINLEDKLFYPGLVGGKWKGLKLLYDVKKAFNFNYEVPEGFVITTLAVNKYLKDIDLEKYIDMSIFGISEDNRKKIRERIESNKFLEKNPELKEKITGLSEGIVIRSSMYGEDGASNFSGTYESVSCSNKEDEINKAVNKVIESYFSDEAISCREDIGLAHIPGINLIVQKRIDGKGGVVHVTSQGCSLTYAITPEEAVNGNGNHQDKDSLDELIKEYDLLYKVKDGLKTVYDLFGDIDVEFVIDKENDQVYLTQLRPKYVSPEVISKDNLYNLPEVKVSSLDDLKDTPITENCTVYMKFLGRDNVMDKEPEIMSFIRGNKQYIKGVAGSMPKVAHIPNKIEGHFKIPYLKKEE